jgi:hypothetical protein
MHGAENRVQRQEKADALSLRMEAEAKVCMKYWPSKPKGYREVVSAAGGDQQSVQLFD